MQFYALQLEKKSKSPYPVMPNQLSHLVKITKYNLLVTPNQGVFIFEDML